MTTQSAGRTVGLLVLMQSLGGALVNFSLLEPVFAPPGFLVNAAAHPLRVGLAALIGLATGALSVAVAITAFPVFRQHSRPTALWFVAVAAVNFALTAVENTTVLSMLSLSRAYAEADAAGDSVFQALRLVVASARNWAHYVNLIVASGMLFVLYNGLFRFALIPRPWAAFGMGAALLQLAAVTMPLFGRPMMFPLIMPLGLCHLALIVWLLARGFADRPAGRTLSAMELRD